MSVSRVGKLKNSITIQSLSQGADGYGGYASPSYIIQINDENDNNNYITIKTKENVGIA